MRAATAPKTARHGADYGPLVRLNRGDVVKEVTDDPDAPGRTIKRARVVANHDRALRRNQITKHQHAAAEQYAALLEAASGARRASDGVYVDRSPTPNAFHPAEAALAALQRLRKADAVIGPSGADLVRSYVGSNQTVGEIALRNGWAAEQTMGRLLASLDRLAEWWNV